MSVLQVLYKNKKDKDWQTMGGDSSVLDAAVAIRLQLKVNGFGKMRTTNPALYAGIMRAMRDQCRLPMDVPEHAPAGYICFAEFVNELKANHSGYVAVILKFYHMANAYKMGALDSSICTSYRNGQLDVFPFERVNQMGEGVDFSGLDVEIPLQQQAFVGCTFDGCHVHGNLKKTGFYGCHMKDVSFKGAGVYEAGNGCVTFSYCYLYGAKYMADMGHYGVLQQHETTYDMVQHATFSAHKGLVYLNDNLFTNTQNPVFKGGYDGGYSVETAQKPCLVSEFDDEKCKAPAYVPKPGKVLAQHIKNGVTPGSQPPADKVWLDGKLVKKADTRTCQITGWTVDRDWVEDYRLGESLTGLFGLTTRVDLCHDSRGLRHSNVMALPIVRSQLVERCRVSNIWFLMNEIAAHGHSFYHATLVPRERIAGHRARHGTLQFYTAEHEDPNVIEGVPFFGFELEVEMQRDTKKINALKLGEGQKQLIIEGNERAFEPVVDEITKDKFFLTKSDGSLRFGYEIVSQPFSWGWWNAHRDGRIENLLKLLRESGYISHDSGRAGLHVHMARKGFQNQKSKDGKFVGSLHLWRFSRMIYGNPEFSIWMSRRESKNPNYAKIEPVKFNNSKAREVVTHANSVCERYAAVNYCNEHTVEIRMFRGTLNFKSFCASLELCHALWAYTATPTNVLCMRAFVKWVNTGYSFDAKGQRTMLYPYLSGLFRHKATPSELGKPSELEQVLSKTWKYAEEGWEHKLPAKAIKMGMVQEATR